MKVLIILIIGLLVVGFERNTVLGNHSVEI